MEPRGNIRSGNALPAAYGLQACKPPPAIVSAGSAGALKTIAPS